MRNLFFKILIPLFIASAIGAWFYHGFIWIPTLLAFFIIVGMVNSLQAKHSILRNFPVLGYFRYSFEFISPELQQYFIERNTDGKPFSRQHRSLAYQRAKNIEATTPFGTQLEINNSSYEGLRHSIYPAPVLSELPRTTVGGDQCRQPYSASLLNISAMSYGSLSAHAVMALNQGAKQGNFYHNTGEGGLTEFHLQGGDVVWQIGTGYFGCRTHDGNFDPEKFRKKAANPAVKMIELKISQGAKPGHGGVLPAIKNTVQIAKIRDIEPHIDVLSPPGHRVFSDAAGLVKFIGQLRELSDGKPVGFKLCIGKASEFIDICVAMKTANIYPDFITVDGAEGGTGAAPLEFSDGVGMPFEPAVIFVHQTLVKHEIRDKMKIICSGKILTGISFLHALAVGADMCNSARGFLFSLGCIQALRCNTNNCPTGVATQNKVLMKGLVVSDKKDRVMHYHHNTLHAAMELLAACGKKNFDEVDIDMFMRGDEFVKLADVYFPDNFPLDPNVSKMN
jgi:glutamate synthase domain-containing protein 2